jgi:peptide/nickel transport system ATP-binding protein
VSGRVHVFPAPSEGTTEPIFAAQGLGKTFRVGGLWRSRDVVAVEGVDLTIAPREVLGLVGESGSGKSTVARLIAKLYEPTAGTLELAGERVPVGLRGRALRSYRKRVQMIFQDPFSSLNTVYPISYTLARPLLVHGLATKREVRGKVTALLERCGLRPAGRYLDRYPYELSGGERQRVGIARALAPEPQLVLADEPTSMLDVSIRLDIMNLLLGLKEQEGLSLLFITHDLAGAHYMSDRIAVMYAGRLMEVGPSTALISAPKHPYTQLLKRAAPKPETGLAPERIEARGEIPDAGALPGGCPFAPRCPFAHARCTERLPELVEATPGHRVRCVLFYPDAQRVNPEGVAGVRAASRA